MNLELESMFERAEELLRELDNEYKNCLRAQNVTKRAENITHEILDKLKNALDHIMRRAWEKFIAINLSKMDKKRAYVYFPIADDLNSFRSTLGRGLMADLDRNHKSLYDFLLRHQPFSSKKNQWLKLLRKISVEGKHIRLIPQKRKVISRRKIYKPKEKGISVIIRDGEIPKLIIGIKNNRKLLTHPKTQTIIPSPDVIEEREDWICFIIKGYRVNAIKFCDEACKKTRVIIEEMINIFQL